MINGLISHQIFLPSVILVHINKLSPILLWHEEIMIFLNYLECVGSNSLFLQVRSSKTLYSIKYISLIHALFMNLLHFKKCQKDKIIRSLLATGVLRPCYVLHGSKSNQLDPFVCSQIYAKLNFHIYSLVTVFSSATLTSEEG